MTMRKVSLFAALVVAMTAVSCVKEQPTENTDVNQSTNPVVSPVTFEASFGVISKAVLEAGAQESKVAWESADQVSVLVGEGNYLYEAQEDGYSTTLVTEATDVPTEGAYYAVYPYDENAVLEGETIATTLPAIQTASLNSFSAHLSVSKAVDNTLSFRNVYGLVRVNVASDGVTRVTFAGNNNENVAGKIAVTVSSTPTYEVLDGATTLELVPAVGATTLARGDYYFAVLPQTFDEGITVTAYKGEKAWDTRKTSTPLTIARSDMKNSNPFGVVGSGTEADPYLLDSSLDLIEMRTLAISGGETWFKMVKDIDMEGVKWIPVNYDSPFNRKIHFDGGNHTISNFSYDKSVNGGDYASFFGVLYGTCKNVNFDNAKITSSGACGVLGGYVGTSGKPALVENVHITNSSVSCSGNPAGGVTGIAREATFKNVSYQGSVASTYTTIGNSATVGGFAGKTVGLNSFESCSANVEVTATLTDVAGFVGLIEGDITIKNCSSAGTVTSNGTNNGGFIGSLAGAQKLHVEKSYSSVVVKGAANSGGFVGYMAPTGDNEVTITRSYATGNLTSGGNHTGGFIGYINSSNTNLLIENCYAHGNVSGSGKQRSGGFIGCVEKNVTVNNCYAKGDMGPLGPMAGGFIGAARNWPSNNKDYNGNAVLNITVTNSIAWPSTVTSSATSGQWSSSPMIAVSSLVNTYTNLYYNPDVVVTDPYFTENWSHPDVSPESPITAVFGGIGQWNTNYTCYIASSYCGRPAPTGSTISSVAKSIGWNENVWDFSQDVPTLK